MNLLGNHVQRDHCGVGGIAALLLVPVWGWSSSALFWLANIFLDTDHYIHYLYAHRGNNPWSVAAMFRYHQSLFEQAGRPDFLVLEIFHTFEFLGLLGWISFFFWRPLIPVFWGSVFHMVVDFFHLSYHKVTFARAYSFVEYGIRRDRLKKTISASRTDSSTMSLPKSKH